jgi:perosamine synthetase
MTATQTRASTSPLALQGGPKAVPSFDESLFHWPIVTAEDEQAVIAVLREGSMSGGHISRQFEAEWGQYLGTTYNVSHPNGTMALLSAMFACGVGRGDEVIVPSLTYWATALPALQLGATLVFADCEKDSLCIDPKDVEKRITRRTRAIVPVHYCGHPADMDPIMALAKRHGIKVIEDVSHAHGTLYKGRMTGSIGDVGAMSMMAGKSFPIGEGGMLSTNRREIFERTLVFAHYERIPGEVQDPALRKVALNAEGTYGLPLGGAKGRLNQTCAAMGRVQLKHYPARIKAIQGALNRFWDLLEGVPGLQPHRPAKNSGSTMGGWYNPVGHYAPEELGGLPVEKFIEAVNAEGGLSGRGCNIPLHLHPMVNEADTFHDGKPTRIAFADRDVRQRAGSLPVTEGIPGRAFGVPYFKHDRPEQIERYATAYRKVAENAKRLL